MVGGHLRAAPVAGVVPGESSQLKPQKRAIAVAAEVETKTYTRGTVGGEGGTSVESQDQPNHSEKRRRASRTARCAGGTAACRNPLRLPMMSTMIRCGDCGVDVDDSITCEIVGSRAVAMEMAPSAGSRPPFRPCGP